MKHYSMNPKEIEKKSMEIIRKELAVREKVLPEELASVILRVIHTTADFDYADTMAFSQGAVRKAKEALRAGAWIVTDTNMALAGINKKELKRWGGEARCFMADPDVASLALSRGITRAAASMEKASALKGPVIYAVGNAPTALLTLKDLMDKRLCRPALIIGVPVGFVNVVDAKEQIMESQVPWIVNRGRKGGSGVAAAICNAILYSMREESGEGQG